MIQLEREKDLSEIKLAGAIAHGLSLDAGDTEEHVRSAAIIAMFGACFRIFDAKLIEHRRESTDDSSGDS